MISSVTIAKGAIRPGYERLYRFVWANTEVVQSKPATSSLPGDRVHEGMDEAVKNSSAEIARSSNFRLAPVPKSGSRQLASPKGGTHVGGGTRFTVKRAGKAGSLRLLDRVSRSMLACRLLKRKSHSRSSLIIEREAQFAYLCCYGHPPTEYVRYGITERGTCLGASTSCNGVCGLEGSLRVKQAQGTEVVRIAHGACSQHKWQETSSRVRRVYSLSA